MTIVITTPTGNVGSRVAALLLENNERITVVARSKERVAHLAEKGANVIEGSHGDPDLLTEATKDAAALFVVTPPDLQSEDIIGHYKTFGAAATKAVETNSIPHVVQLSSVGADLPGGTGPILGLYENEKSLNGAAKNVIHLRPGYFMENTLMQLPTVVRMGQMFTTFGGDKSFPMIATRDIAHRAASLLSKRDWTGSHVVELMGPEDMSHNRIAEILTETLGREITHVTVPGSALVESILQMGGSRQIGEAFLEMSGAIESGHIHFNGERDHASRTPTTFRTFAEEVFKPALQAAG